MSALLHRPSSIAALLTAALVLGGCASFSPDRGLVSVNAITAPALGQEAFAVRTPEQAEAVSLRVKALLRKPLNADRAAHIALLNNRDLQAAYNALGLSEAAMVQASLPPNPTFSLERIAGGGAVEIEARIVKTTKTYARALGIQWGFQGRVDPQIGNATNMAFPNSGSLGGVATGAGAAVPNTAVNLPAVAGKTPIATAVGLALGSVNGSFNLDAALTAGESSGNVRLLSTPRVSTQNNVEAEIAQGVQIPYQTVSNNTVTTQFKDAALTLKVIPQITEAGTVIMKIAVDNGSVGEIFNGVPSINTQRATTTVLVGDGQTTVIGGIYAAENHVDNNRVPGLGSVPLIKWLFRRDSVSDENSELLIFITPRITKG